MSHKTIEQNQAIVDKLAEIKVAEDEREKAFRKQQAREIEEHNAEKTRKLEMRKELQEEHDKEIIYIENIKSAALDRELRNKAEIKDLDAINSRLKTRYEIESGHKFTGDRGALGEGNDRIPQGHSEGGPVKGYATGGFVWNEIPSGWDNGNHGDTIPAMLSPGEYVVNAQAASGNMELLNNINSGENRLKADILANGGNPNDAYWKGYFNSDWYKNSHRQDVIPQVKSASASTSSFGGITSSKGGKPISIGSMVVNLSKVPDVQSLIRGIETEVRRNTIRLNEER